MRIAVRCSAVLLIIVLGLLGGRAGSLQTRHAASGTEGPAVYPPDASVHGATLGEWSARHWQWVTSFPSGLNPGHDVTGATCGYGQSGPVFFIPRNFPPCIVPAGVALFVPIAGAECSTLESAPYYGRSEVELRACSVDDADRYTRIVVRLDEEVVPAITTYRVASPRFTLMLPEANVLGAPPGAAYAVADGYQMLVKPLPVGEHEIVAHVELTDGTVLPDKVLRVTVVAPGGLDLGASPVPETPAAGSLSQPGPAQA